MNCPVCKTEKSITILRKDTVILHRCLGCGLTYSSYVSEDFKEEIYGYYANKTGHDREKIYNPITQKRYVDLLNRISRYRKNNELLDIGCGEGHFITVAGQKGWNASGIERSVCATQICRSFSLNVINTDLLELNTGEKRFDVVTMFEVLEHLNRPYEYLLKVRDILRKKGVFIITTPNFNCITRLLLQEKWSLVSQQHTLYFTEKTVKSLLNRCGFRVVELKTKNVSLPELKKIFKKKVEKTYTRNQMLRNAIEENRPLVILKDIANNFLKWTGTGETIECLSEKV